MTMQAVDPASGSNSTMHQMTDPLNVKVIIIPTTRSPEVDPEVNLEADHLVDLAVLLPDVTEFILVTGLMSMTGVETRTIGWIVAHTIVMIVTDAVPVTTDIIMTDIMTSTVADIMTGVMTGGMVTEVGTGLQAGVLLVDLKAILGLMTIVQMT